MRYYYIDENSEVKGPCSKVELSTLKASGRLDNSSLLCEEGQQDWIEFHAVLQQTTQKQNLRTTQTPKATETEIRTLKQPRKETPGSGGATRTQATIIILLLLVGLGMPFWGMLRPIPQWEYTQLTFLAGSNERTGEEAFKYSSVSLNQSKLDEMGQAGWEIVGSYLEMETAFPNFGKDDYVTGIQPNIRPQSLVILFKRPLR